ncbi:peptidoglycan glycosyltransferase [Blastomonas natatoria]|uniref:Peptidoglycan glycosyltransferase n=1 Tax=Blastomonas natatoria TaxID=34015 RepID=A0A2V3V2A3_9SPHN|nr:penicillin-binding protein 2 [Blastomonas natatoria]PXW75051.1 peptidoglycan glycosyltransferase [Blastomonas natatoria]
MLRPGKLITRNSLNITFNRRTMLIGGAQGLVGAILAGRMAYISIVENERYKMLSESNRVNLTLIPPRRGWIIDRNGKPLANNKADFRVDLIPQRVRDVEGTISQLGNILKMTPDAIDDLRAAMKDARGLQPVPVASGLTYEDFAALSVRLPDLPGVAPQRGFSRQYPTGAAVGHLLGYVGIANAEEYEENKNPLLITPGFKIGKDGLEKYFEPQLQGKPGARKVEVTARGKIVRELGVQEDVPGKPLKLTIDGGLQEFVARRMGRESGAAAVIDCQTGGILAFSSMPSFDPNSFSDGIGRLEYAMLSQDERVPLLNKATRGLYPPGSTLKPMAAVACLQHGVDPEETVNCPGGYRLGNRFYQCLGRHGPVNMVRAIEKSCNTYFYAQAHRLGYDKIAMVAREMGLGEDFDLAGLNQRYGTIPDSEWKMRKYKQAWTASDSLNAVIGQGYVIVNPLQLAVMTARLASGRKLYPHLIPDDKVAPTLPYPPEHLAVAQLGMAQVVSQGTAARSKLPLDGIAMAGKTGTAQVRGFGSGSRGGAGVPWKYRDHGLFVCFAPVEQPLYAAAVVIEHGLGGSRAAAPVAKDFMTYMFDPQKAMDSLLAMEAAWGGDIQQRMAAEFALFRARAEGRVPEAPSEEAAD